MTTSKALITGYAMALTVVCIWSGFIVISRFGATNALNSFDLISIRYVTATLIALPLWFFIKRHISIFTKQYFTIALFGGIFYASCAFMAFGLAPASHAAVFLPGFMPVSISLCIWVLLGERVKGKGLLALGIISFGVLLLASSTLTVSKSTLAGDLLFMTAATSWGVFNALLKKWQPDPIATTAAVSLYTSVLYVPIYLLFLPHEISNAPMFEIAIQVIYQGVIAAVIQVLLYVKAAKAIGASNMAVTMALVPVLASLIAVPVLGEQLNAIIVISLLCVTGGAIYGNIHGNKVKAKDENVSEVLQE